jgi:transposase-like protein
MNLIQLRNNLPTELHCVEYAESIRWPKGVRCTHCNSKNIGERNKDFRYHCKDCQKSFSVKAKTVLHDSRLPLSTWFSAVSVITDAKKGMSAKQLERNIGVSYGTAWNMYHRIRDLMEWENPEPDSLHGVVEMDETYIGGKPRKMSKFPHDRKNPEMDEQIKELRAKGHRFNRKRGNSAKPDLNPKSGYGDKIRVTGIVQRNGNVIAEVMKKISPEEIRKMVEKYVDEDNAVLITDEAGSYKRIHKIIDHIAVDHSRMYSYRGVNTNSIESFWAIIKRGIFGQYHKVSAKYLPNYISEFVFKYNNRTQDAAMFDALIENLLTELPFDK